MTDKEMLELAAKAAEMKVKGEIDWVDGKTMWLLVKVDGRPKFRWNPLEDDGDALRLAVKLGMRVEVRGEVETEAKYWLKSDGYNYLAEGHFIGSFAATRRAIVRAAAEIGKGT
ncbi:hypothetical protein PIN31009_01885 [Pandoraea iniqua]|uniref:hypothetical protein n=1 Tax=Pandoraea iniqua TaxID=2508288 RepID=UPI0012419C7E|nr:hypothetical protein [Pandoraea iniqua]VVD96155.1 hypothetical protein PIN31009_01885 [Pandoraea iniqua]